MSLERSPEAGPAPSRVSFVGGVGVGKTTLLMTRLGKATDGTVPTAGVMFETLEICVDGRHVLLHCYDTGGMEANGTLPGVYMRNVDVIALCFDPLMEDWVSTCKAALSQVDSEKKPRIVAIATKQDLWREALNPPALHATVKKEFGVQAFVITASTMKVGVDEAFDAIAREALTALPSQPTSIFDSTLAHDPNTKSQGCNC